MSSITIHNYEAYLLDLAEGNLSEEQQLELELFLIQHPELNYALDEQISTHLIPEEIIFHSKSSLKKHNKDLLSDEQLISYVEQIANEQERAFVELSCVNNPELAHELKLYKATIVEADKTVLFNYKDDLKKQPKLIWFHFASVEFVSIAASLVLMIGLFVLWQNMQPLNEIDTSNGFSSNQSSLPRVVENISVEQPELKKEQPILAHKPASSNNKILIQNQKVLPISTNLFNQDSIPPLPTNIEKDLISQNEQTNKNIEQVKNSLETSSTIVQVMSENDDEPVVQKSIEAPTLLTRASRLLKNLNKLGLKSVDGKEETNTSNAGFALTIGDLTVTHHSNSQ